MKAGLNLRVRPVGPAGAAALAAALALCSCSTTLDATFEVTTEAVERTVSERSVELNSLGDRFAMPAGIESGRVVWDGGEAPAGAGSEIRVETAPVDRAPGRVTRLLVDGREAASRDGFLGVRALWRSTSDKVLPPVVWTREISLEPGGSVEIDQTVMYSCAGTSTFRDLRTTWKFSGDDAAYFGFRPSIPVEGGRMKGTIYVGRKDGEERGKDKETR